MKVIRKVLLNAISGIVFASIVIFCNSCASQKITETELQQTSLQMDTSIIQGNLENGMKFFVKENSEPKNRIVLRLVVKAGSNMEEDDQLGVAHFIEHLAFNGTENFEKSAIIDYFEKIGMDFGSDLNAYTSFEETVYKLEIPADDPEILKTALLILHDWAGSVSFDEEEINKERGVVTEEWRLRQGLQGRTTDKIIPLLLKDSRYEKRLPIGDMEIIGSIGRERILDFYNTWYRPEFMSVVAVGDIDSDILIKEIKEVMGTIPASKKTIEHPEYTVPVQTEKKISLMLDSEQKYEVIQIFQQHPENKVAVTEEEFEKDLALSIGREIFNSRLAEKSNSAETNWLESFASTLEYTHTSNFEYYGIVPKSGLFETGFKDFIDEYDRFVLFGVTSAEVERIKTAVLTNIEQNYKNREKIPSSSHADEIVNYFLTEGIIISAQDGYDISKKILEKISVDEINEEIRKYFLDRGTLMFVQAPAAASDIPTEEEIMKLWTEYKSENPLEAYEEEDYSKVFENRPTKKGKIVSQKNIPEMDVNEYEFDNGIKVYTKQTDFVENKIQMQAISKGGLYLVSEKDVPSAMYSANYRLLSGMSGLDYSQFIKAISTKNIGFDFDIGSNTEYFAGSATNEDLEVLLNCMNQIFTDYNFTEEGWTILKTSLEETAKQHGLQPRDVFLDEIKRTLFGDDIFQAPLDMNLVNKMNSQAAASTFAKRFENPADFTFVFVGNFDEENLMDLLSYYLGSLKTTPAKEKKTYKLYDFPEGIVEKTVYKGLDQQGQVYIGLGGKMPEMKKIDIEQSYYDQFMASELTELLNIWLREAIREDKSGCYGIGVHNSLDGEKERTFYYEISFGCDPNRAEELTQEVLNQIKQIQTNPIPQDYVEKLKETLRRSREVNLRNNNWWMNRIVQQVVFQQQPMWVSSDIEKIAQWITAEALQEQAKKYLNTENYVTINLKPEK